MHLSTSDKLLSGFVASLFLFSWTLYLGRQLQSTPLYVCECDAAGTVPIASQSHGTARSDFCVLQRVRACLLYGASDNVLLKPYPTTLANSTMFLADACYPTEAEALNKATELCASSATRLWGWAIYIRGQLVLDGTTAEKMQWELWTIRGVVFSATCVLLAIILWYGHTVRRVCAKAGE